MNELEILRDEIDGETQVYIVLISLPESFKAFRLNYSISKESYSLAELLKELQAAERIIDRKSTRLNSSPGSYSEDDISSERTGDSGSRD